MSKLHVFGLFLLAFHCHLAPASDLEFDQDVTPDVIFGSGNDNGSFTTDRHSGVELGLRGKLRHNSLGSPENTFNSNGDGTYSFQPGVAPTQSSSTAEWSFEWSVNTDYDGSSGWMLDDLTYELGLDSNPSLGTDYVAFDPISPSLLVPDWDHAIGHNGTSNGDGFVRVNTADYEDLISDFNVAQNSWKPHWFIVPFDPTVEGNYSIYLTAFDADGFVVANTAIEIIVGDDSDGDGLPDGADGCVDSDLSPTVVVGGDCDSGVSNTVFDDGCSLADIVNLVVDDCASTAKNHGQFVKCVGKALNALKKDGLITGSEKGALQSCVAKLK